MGGLEIAVSPVQYEQYSAAAIELATRTDLATLHPCDASTAGEDACAIRFIEEVGLRAYRRPLDGDMKARLAAVYDVGRAEGGYEGGLRLVLRAMLESPFFLYKIEASGEGAPGEVVALDGYERASRLSYLIWGSMPDEQLFAAAAVGELSTPDGVAAHARRMLDEDRARESVQRFYTQWLRLHLEDGVVPGLADGVAPAMQASTARFVDHVIFESTGTLSELLTADYAFVDESLAEIYGLEGVTGTELVRREVDPSERAGILTHPSVLAQTASLGAAIPVFRGRLVREQLLCQMLPEPPDDIPPFSEAGTETQSLRDRLAQHRADPTCAGCHDRIDPIGFLFEHYDALGAYRTETIAGPVDASGEITDTPSTDGELDGAIELAHRLAESDDVRRCMSEQWLRFGLARYIGEGDRCSLDQMNEAFVESGYDLRELVVAVTRTDAFLHRRVGEVTP